jgi:(2S)-methylsuccinyl-CoA dehydrogenase
MQVTALLERIAPLVDTGFATLHARCATAGRLDANALDRWQLPSYELAFCAAELSAARAVQDWAATTTAQRDPLARLLADSFAVEVAAQIAARLLARPGDYGLDAARIAACHPSQHAELAQLVSSETLAALGAQLLQRDGRLPPSGLDQEHELMRDSFLQFAREVVLPEAQRIHREDRDIPEDIIRGAAELGLFGVSIPQLYGGLQPDDHPDTIAMLVVTEATSAASLGAAGSLVTRPEIMARAVLQGGTDAQRQRWLPALASGEKLVAISITEPDFGSDVAGLRLRATRVDGGWSLSGAKTWCTLAGRAEYILVIARTDPDPALGHRGLSQFVVEKPRFAGHEFEYLSPLGGRVVGRAIPTLGYRGMHSFEMFYEDFVVPADALVGGEAGLGRGFYLTMAGLSGGRVQTSARANGVMQAAFDAGVRYASARRVFGQPIGAYSLTQARLARVAAWLTASRQFSYRVAAELDAGRGDTDASMVKLFSCRAAEWVTRDMMQLHGGMGYAEETDASRYFVDARVLSIFEGAEETLALKVIARDLIARAGLAATSVA